MTHYLALWDADDAIINVRVRTANSLASVTMFDVLCKISYGDMFPSLSFSFFSRGSLEGYSEKRRKTEIPHRSRRVFSIFTFSTLLPFSDLFEAPSRKNRNLRPYRRRGSYTLPAVVATRKAFFTSSIGGASG